MHSPLAQIPLMSAHSSTSISRFIGFKILSKKMLIHQRPTQGCSLILIGRKLMLNMKQKDPFIFVFPGQNLNMLAPKI